MSLILLIDDDDMNRTTLKHAFEDAGHLVTEAAGGQEGLNAARSSIPALIILDLMLPEMNGWQVCRQLKNSPATKSIPIIILTSSVRDSDELLGWESGVDNYLTKPWGLDNLMSAVAPFLTPIKAA